MGESVAESSNMEWVENQRRFIVRDLEVVDGRTDFYLINQAYLFNAAGWVVRVRRTFQPDDENPPRPVGSSLTYKGPRVDGRRVKGEMPLSERTAAQLFGAATDKIFKRRYAMVHDGLTVAIDVFFFDNEGLVLAEFETEKPLRRFVPPDWCGREVTRDAEFDNENLAAHGWANWPDAVRRRWMGPASRPRW